MSSERHSDNDGSDIFWPGYVDAVTNLVLNLLFLLTIMIVAVFMFALELGRASNGGAGKTPVISAKDDAKVASKKSEDPVKENIALKREIERLNMLLSKQSSIKVKPAAVIKTVDVTSRVAKPENSIDRTTVASDSDVLVRFTDDAISFTASETERLREVLKPIVANGKTNIFVDVPVGFSEARRMGFYRAMAVRNLLIEMKMPKERINVKVREVKVNSNASLVRVKSY
ncbi:MAG: hypothetical protein PHN84_13490 [Desulfuromonadaceae bacterium]|nr:hypothetical protein [Desulfuromonadaceae bacterium]MDD2854819.1 hypothetical protein [Desulfuromonadaceae bacterium]